MNFGSDNMTGASPQVLEALIHANSGPERSYGNDHWTREAERMLAEVFEHDLAAFFVASGTAANCLALSALVQPWNAILCHRQSHAFIDENSAPELFTGGARLKPVRGSEGKITARALEETFARLPSDPPHNLLASALSLTQASELGLVYGPDEIAALTAIARSRGASVHMDGARFANAVAKLGCHPSEITWKAGVDVLCLGASKNGALAAEAVIFFDPARAKDFTNRRKRTGHLISKGRVFGSQFAGWLRDGHWLDLAHKANHACGLLAEGLARVPGVRIVWPPEANEIFAILPKALDQCLHSAGAVYFEWDVDALPAHESLTADEVFVRLVASFATTDTEIQAFLDAAMAR